MVTESFSDCEFSLELRQSEHYTPENESSIGIIYWSWITKTPIIRAVTNQKNVFRSVGKIPGGKKHVIQLKYIEMHLFAVILTKKNYNLYLLPIFFRCISTLRLKHLANVMFIVSLVS